MDLGIEGIGEATEIGAGASAIVYRAAQRGLQREVAVKILVPTDPDFVRRFRREAELLGKLSQSQRIVTVHDTGVTSAGQPYLVLQLCRGSLLDRIKAESVIEPIEACRIMVGVASGVAAAHELQVVHRDLKPGNILISNEGDYLVTDFGTSVVSGSTTATTSSISFTAGYVAPETLLGSPSSFPVDIYALGATMFHMVSGSAPFVEADAEPDLLALAGRVANDPVPDLRARGVPPAVCDLIEWAMAKEAGDRPTIHQFRAALEAITVPTVVAPLGREPFPDVALAVARPPSRLPDGAELASRVPEPAPVRRSVQLLDVPAPTAPLERSRVTAGLVFARLRPRHLVVAVAGLLVLLIGSAALYSTGSGSDGGGEIAAEPDLPLLVDGPELDESALAGRRPTSAAGAARDGEIDPVDPSPTPVTSEDEVVDDSVPDTPVTTAASRQVRVPSLAGAAEAEARGQLAVADLVAGATSLAFSSTVARGLVIETSPSGRVARGSTVDLVVSLGPAVNVPDVVGLLEPVATAQLSELGLVVTTQLEDSATVPAGSIVSTSPFAGTDVEEGSTVLVVIAADNRPAVPSLAGRSVPEATTILESVQLQLGTITSVDDAEVAAGLIISSTPAEGTKLDSGSPVDVVVSLGPALDPCDGLVGVPEATAVASVVAAGLTPQLTTGFSEVHPVGTVMDCQHDQSSSTVVLSVSQGPAPTVPNVVGMVRAQAEAVLTLAGLPHTVSEVFSEERAGVVVATDPVAGSPVGSATVIVVSVSKGTEPEPEPEPELDQPADDAVT